MTRLGGEADHCRSRGRPIPAEPQRRPPSPAGSFEFVHIIGSDMCAAEDVFFRGQLLPYRPPPTSAASSRSPTQQRPPAACSHGREQHRKSPSEREAHRGRHRRAESLDRYELGDGAASRYWKTKGSVSADYQRLRPVAEEAARAGAGSHRRPKWYVLMLGSVRMPAEMDMRGIRSRAGRRSTSGGDCVRPGSTAVVKTATVGCGGGGGWKLLRSLSCKADVGSVVDAPFRFGLS